MRKHRGWIITGGVVAAWLVCEMITGSFLSATVLLFAMAALTAIAAMFCKHMGYTPELKWPRRSEDGGGQWRAPDYGQRFDAFAPAPAGAARAPAAPPVNGPWVWREEINGLTVAEPNPVGSAMPTVAEHLLAPTPSVRLVTNGSRRETTVSGARAGRGDVELVLPDVPTISREHAKLRFDDGRWWITNLGLNGIMLNGSPVDAERALSDGDTIRWGSRPDALESRVEIG
jgi:FHA domain